MHRQVLLGLCIRHAAIPDQPNSLKLELPRKLPPLHDAPPVPLKHLTWCLRNRVQAIALSFRQSVLSEIPELASVYKYNPPRNYPANLDQTKIITAASSDVDLKLSLYSP